ncbi:MAG: ParA family protein [Hyphomicrobiales bacterium]
MRTIAVAMAKGGVGKTTTAVSLAGGLASLGKRVLLVDCDTQDQVTRFLGVKPPYGLSEFITGNGDGGALVSRNEAIFRARDNLWVLAGGIHLVELKHWLGEQPREMRQSVLAHRLVPREGSIDYLIFDCAPGWDVLSVNILVAASEVLCPVALQGPALEGLKTFFRYLQSAQKLNPELRLKYILPTLFDRRTRHSQEMLTQLERYFGRQLCPPVHYTVRLCEAPIHGRTIFEYDQSSSAAHDYNLLVRRVLNDADQTQPHP